MNITSNQIDKLNLELTMTVTPEDYSAEVKKKLNDYRRKAEFKGFRKGNVPMSLIERVYGEQALGDAVNDIVGEQLYKYIADNGIRTLGEPLSSEKQPEIEWKNGGDFTFIFDLATPEKVEFEVVKEDIVPYYNINVTETAKNEMKKNLKKYYEEKKEEKSEEDLDKEVTDRLTFEYKQEADARLDKDIRNYFVQKAAVELPEDYLKRWLFVLNKGKVSKEDIEKEFPSFLKDFKWQLVRDFLAEKYDIKVESKDIQEAAEGFVVYQYAMYGIGNVPPEMIKEAANNVLSDERQVSRLEEQVLSVKVMDAVKKDITVKTKKISLDKFKAL